MPVERVYTTPDLWAKKIMFALYVTILDIHSRNVRDLNHHL